MTSLYEESNLTESLYSLTRSIPSIKQGLKYIKNNSSEIGKVLKKYLIDMDYGVYKNNPVAKRDINSIRLTAYGFLGLIAGVSIPFAIAQGDFKSIEQMSWFLFSTISATEGSIRVVCPLVYRTK